MKYKNVIKAVFCERINRFTASVVINDVTVNVHIKNTGRLSEILKKGTTVYLSVSDNPMRKTKHDLIAAEKEICGKMNIVNIDSQNANDVAYEWLKKGILFPNATIRREVTYGNSRFDFYIESGGKRIFLEVKGCTLEKEGIAYFPDAPTERGIKHVEELIECIGDGFEAYILFVIQMNGIKEFRPNDEIHKAFGDALRKAKSAGVKILAVDSQVYADGTYADAFVHVVL